jgi:hypothetical protein
MGDCSEATIDKSIVVSARVATSLYPHRLIARLNR